MTEQDYYQVLGVEKDADPKAIRESYRDLAFKFHPDRNQENPGAAERMKGINEAYAVLSNAEKKREYDALRRQFGSSAHGQFRQSYADQDIFRGTDIHQVFEEMARSFGVRGFDEIFKDLHGQGFQTFESRGPGYYRKGFAFTNRPVGRGRRGQGRMGRGMGRIARAMMEKATGVALPCAGADQTDVVQLRPDQAMKGGPHAYETKKTGKRLVVQIPPGIRDGQKIRLAGMGGPGKNGGAPGSLFLEVRIRKPLLGRIREAAGKLLKG